MTRTDAVAGDLLRYGAEHAGGVHGLGLYLETAPVVDGQPVTEEEYQHAVSRAASLGPVTIIMVNGEPFPNGITAQGRHCVEAYKGDIGALQKSRRPAGGTVIHNTITMGDFSQASAFTSGGVAQTLTQITTEPERLRDVARMAQEVLALLPEHLHGEVRAAAQEVAEAADDTADENRLRAAGARLVAALGPASSLFVVVRFIIDALSGGLGG